MVWWVTVSTVIDFVKPDGWDQRFFQASGPMTQKSCLRLLPLGCASLQSKLAKDGGCGYILTVF